MRYWLITLAVIVASPSYGADELEESLADVAHLLTACVSTNTPVFEKTGFKNPGKAADAFCKCMILAKVENGGTVPASERDRCKMQGYKAGAPQD